MSDISKFFRSFQNSVGSSFSYFMEKVQRETYVTNKLNGPFVAIILSDPAATDTVVRGDDGFNQFVPVHVRLLKTTDVFLPDPFVVMENMKNSSSQEKVSKFLKIISMHPIARPSSELITQTPTPIFSAGSLVECDFEDESPEHSGRERGLVYKRILSTTNLFTQLDTDVLESLSGAFDFKAATLLNDFETKGQSATYEGSESSFKGKIIYNGSLPSQLLRTSSAGTIVLVDIVNDLNALEQAFQAQFNETMSGSGNRSYEKQKELKAQWTAKGKPSFAATPGTSNHGWAKAIDFAAITRIYFGATGAGKSDEEAKALAVASPQYKWLKANGSKYGFNQPMDYEPWHWEHKTRVIKNIKDSKN